MGVKVGNLSFRRHCCTGAEFSQVTLNVKRSALIVQSSRRFLTLLRPLTACEISTNAERETMNIKRSVELLASFWRPVTFTSPNDQPGARSVYIELAPAAVSLLIGWVVGDGVLISELINDTGKGIF